MMMPEGPSPRTRRPPGTDRRTAIGHRGRAALLVAAILVPKGCCCEQPTYDSSDGCGGGWGVSDAGVSGGAGGGGAGGSSAGGSGGALPDSSVDCLPGETPPSIPAGWERVSAWACDCPYYVPVIPELTLPPIAWEDCGDQAPPGYACSQLTRQFDDEALVSISPSASVSVEQASGLVLLQVDFDQERESDTVRFSVVVEDATGTVRHAAAHVLSAHCEFGPGRSVDDRYLITLAAGDGPSLAGRSTEGFAAGQIDVAPPQASIVLDAIEGETSDWLVTPSWIVQRNGRQTARLWDLATETTVYDPWSVPNRPEGLVVGGAGHALYVELGAPKQRQVAVWTLKTGLQPLLGKGDGTEAIGNFATDGVDMVWTRARIDTVDGGAANVFSLMTAPVSTMASDVQTAMRRVREDVAGFGPQGWAVGCGRAARIASYGSKSNRTLFVVDLQDGTTVETPSVEGASGERVWSSVVGVTCDSVYLMAQSSGAMKLWKLGREQQDAGIDSGSDAAPDPPDGSGDGAGE